MISAPASRSPSCTKRYLSGFRVGATSALAVAKVARADAQVLGLFGTGHPGLPQLPRDLRGAADPARAGVQPECGAPRGVRCAAGERDVEVVAVDDARAVVRGADIVCCATNAQVPVFEGEWLEPGQMVVTIANSDVLGTRREVDETTFARARDIVINDWDERRPRTARSSSPSRSRKGLVRARERAHARRHRRRQGRGSREQPDAIVYYKNNTGLAMQFAACGAILYPKLKAEGTKRIIPREWLAGSQYGL